MHYSRITMYYLTPLHVANTIYILQVMVNRLTIAMQTVLQPHSAITVIVGSDTHTATLFHSATLHLYSI